MMLSVSLLGHKLSALAGSVVHARDTATSKARVLLAGAFFGLAFLLSTTQLAMAQQTLQEYSTVVSMKTNIIVDIVSYICYIGGAILSALGVLDLKKHVENPSQTPMKNGLAKLGFGGILLALPFVSGIMQETMGGYGEATFQQFNRGGIKIQ